MAKKANITHYKVGPRKISPKFQVCNKCKGRIFKGSPFHRVEFRIKQTGYPLPLSRTVTVCPKCIE